MRTVFVLFDSLNRRAIGAYGGSALRTPNFDRFAAKAVVFDNNYVGSLPCMPARRDIHTGRLNYMHRTWGPLEPFDDSFARILSRNGVYTHLISDHLHYFEDGGWGYANAFDSWDFIRGQEYDAVKALVQPPIARYREMFDGRHYPMGDLEDATAITRGTTAKMAWKKSRGAINQVFLEEEQDFPTAKCFASAFEFLDLNSEADNWFLQLECFDPHEPFVAPERFRDAYASGYKGKILNWPMYEQSTGSEEEIAEIRGNYAALVAMCDEYFGKLLDYFDTNGLWDDTCLVLTTDHGFLLSEHDWWGKNRMPYYEEISHIPLMIWHPRHSAQAGQRRASLTQTPDLMPTFLDFHECAAPPSVTGVSLVPLLGGDTPVRDSLTFGMFAGPVGVTDGKYSYFRYPVENDPKQLSLYTLMPMHLAEQFSVEELKSAKLVEGFDFMKGAPVLKVPLSVERTQVGMDGQTLGAFSTALFDLDEDPGQSRPIRNDTVEDMFTAAIFKDFARHDAPQELYSYFGLGRPESGSRSNEQFVARME
nr:sulfatase [Nitratireductor sp. XY-223]